MGPGTYELSGPETNEREELTVEPGQDVQRDFAVGRIARGKLHGRVLRTRSSRGPVAGAEVKGESIKPGSHAGFTTTTDDDGRFTTMRWHDRMIVYARDAKGREAGYTVISEDDKTADIKVAAAGRVSGRIVDSRGRVWPRQRVQCGITLRVGDETAHISVHVLTDARGRFEIGGLVVGADCNLYAYDEQKSLFRVEFTVEQAGAVDIGDVVTTKERPAAGSDAPAL